MLLVTDAVKMVLQEIFKELVEQDDRLAAINYQVTMMMVVSLLRYVYIEQEKRQRLPEISCQPYSESYDVCHSSER